MNHDSVLVEIMVSLCNDLLASLKACAPCFVDMVADLAVATEAAIQVTKGDLDLAIDLAMVIKEAMEVAVVMEANQATAIKEDTAIKEATAQATETVVMKANLICSNHYHFDTLQ